MKILKQKNSGFRHAVTKDFAKNKALYIMVIPVVLYYILFHYVPMYGTIIAFKDYMPIQGILGSKWAGFRHFVEFFESPYFSENSSR